MEQPRRITAREFGAMLAADVFDEEHARVELLDGLIYSLAPPEGNPHRRTINKLNRLLTTRFAEPDVVQVQSSLHLGTFDVPAPDFVIFRATDDYDEYADRNQVVLVIEVAVSSLRHDRVRKAPLFARYGMAEYWIVNVLRREVEVYTGAADGTYRSLRTFMAGESIEPPVVPGEPLTPADFIVD